MEQDREQGIGSARGQGICQRGGHGHQQRGQRGGHGAHQRVGHERGGGRTVVSNEVRAIIVDHVVNRGLTMAEEGRLVDPNLKRTTVNSSIRSFRQENRIERKPHSGGCGCVLTDQQELAVVEMVRARNDMWLSEIKQAIENNDTFANVACISLPTVAHLLKRHQVSMKPIYLVPFESNNDRVKQIRAQYVQRVMVLDADVNHHKYIFVAKTRRRGRNIIAQRATVQVPGQRGGNLSMCAAISEDGDVGHYLAPIMLHILMSFSIKLSCPVKVKGSPM